MEDPPSTIRLDRVLRHVGFVGCERLLLTLDVPGDMRLERVDVALGSGVETQIRGRLLHLTRLRQGSLQRSGIVGQRELVPA